MYVGVGVWGWVGGGRLEIEREEYSCSFTKF